MIKDLKLARFLLETLLACKLALYGEDMQVLYFSSANYESIN